MYVYECLNECVCVCICVCICVHCMFFSCSIILCLRLIIIKYFNPAPKPMVLMKIFESFVQSIMEVNPEDFRQVFPPLFRHPFTISLLTILSDHFAYVRLLNSFKPFIAPIRCDLFPAIPAAARGVVFQPCLHFCPVRTICIRKKNGIQDQNSHKDKRKVD